MQSVTTTRTGTRPKTKTIFQLLDPDVRGRNFFTGIPVLLSEYSAIKLVETYLAAFRERSKTPTSISTFHELLGCFNRCDTVLDDMHNTIRFMF